MHKWLETNTDIVKSGLPDYSISGQINWSGGGTALSTSNFVPDREIEVEISAPGASFYTWTKTNGSGQWWANAGGFYANIDIGSSNYIVFKVETEANCNDITEYFDFNYIGNFYKAYPNPMENILHIDVNKEKQAIAGGQYTSKMTHHLKIYDQYRSLKINQELNSGSGSHTINLSNLRKGLYLVELKNQYFTKIFKIQKL